MAIWQWIQNELLGMQWLNRLIGGGLAALGVDVSTRLGGSLQFFLYDVIKITVLLCVLIFVISYIQSYFPPERSRRILGRRHGLGANLALGEGFHILDLHVPTACVRNFWLTGLPFFLLGCWMAGKQEEIRSSDKSGS